MAWKPYKIKPLKKPPLPRPGVVRQPPKPGERLSGYIGRFKASDIEERTSRALDKKEMGYKFRQQFIPSDPPIMISGESGRNQLGAIEVDFMMNVGGMLIAAQVDGAFSHKTAEQKQGDTKKDAQLLQVLTSLGGGKVVRIPFTYLGTQEQADQTISQLLAGRWEFR